MRLLTGARYVAYARLYNRFWDAVTVLAGGCNARPAEGGYAHWRCMRKRGHLAVNPHRANNYIWAETGRPQYDPIGPEWGDARVKTVEAWINMRQRDVPFYNLVSKRKMIRTRRAEREMRREAEAALQRLREERRVNGVR